MKKILLVLAIIFSLALTTAGISEAAVRVKGHTTRNGTYVAPHYRSSPDKSTLNNWSTKGNYNPYTGKKGSTAPSRPVYRPRK